MKPFIQLRPDCAVALVMKIDSKTCPETSKSFELLKQPESSHFWRLALFFLDFAENFGLASYSVTLKELRN
jgi:hypothetical protein